MSQRARFLQVAEDLEGLPYLWGGKLLSLGGLDCSGLVTHSLWRAGGPDWRQTHNAHALWTQLPAVELPLPGDLALYGSAVRATHVVICTPTGVIGASGGGRETTSIAAALAQKARVRREPSPSYRRDLLGFRRLPLLGGP